MKIVTTRYHVAVLDVVRCLSLVFHSWKSSLGELDV